MSLVEQSLPAVFMCFGDPMKCIDSKRALHLSSAVLLVSFAFSASGEEIDVNSAEAPSESMSSAPAQPGEWTPAKSAATAQAKPKPQAPANGVDAPSFGGAVYNPFSVSAPATVHRQVPAEATDTVNELWMELTVIALVAAAVALTWLVRRA